MQKTSKISFQYCSTLALISVVSLWLGWQLHPLFLFVGFAPLLMIEARIAQQQQGGIIFWLFCLAIMLGWNTATTWWLGNATIAGALVAVLLNSLLMTLPWAAYTLPAKSWATTMVISPLYFIG